MYISDLIDIKKADKNTKTRSAIKTFQEEDPYYASTNLEGVLLTEWLVEFILKVEKSFVEDVTPVMSHKERNVYSVYVNPSVTTIDDIQNVAAINLDAYLATLTEEYFTLNSPEQ